MSALRLTGVAGLAAGTMSTTVGEYVSVHSQADPLHCLDPVSKENRRPRSNDGWFWEPADDSNGGYPLIDG